MRIFKQILLIVLAFSMLLSLSSCIVIPLSAHYDDIDKNTVISIDIYDLRNSEIRHSNFYKTQFPVYTLTQEQNNLFLDELEDIEFSNDIVIILAAIDPSFYFGDWTVRINYSDGSFSLISNAGYSEKLDKDGNGISGNHYYCDDQIWFDFISKYLPEDYFNTDVEQPTTDV